MSLSAVGAAAQSRPAPPEGSSTYLPGSVTVPYTVAKTDCRALFFGRYARPGTDGPYEKDRVGCWMKQRTLLRHLDQAVGDAVLVIPHLAVTHPTLLCAMVSLLLLPGQPVREKDLVPNALRCLNELWSGGMPQQDGCGTHASVVDAALGRFHCGARQTCAEQPTADDRAVLNDLLGGIDYHVESSGFTPPVITGGTTASHQVAGAQWC